MAVRWFEAIDQSPEFGVIDVIPYFFLSRLYSLSARRQPTAKNTLSPVTAPISSLLTRKKLIYLFLADVTGSYRLRPDLLTSILLKVTAMGEWDFFVTEKRQRKKVYWRSFSTPANEYPMYFIKCCKNIHSNWITITTVASLPWGYFPAVLVIARMFSFTSTFDILANNV